MHHSAGARRQSGLRPNPVEGNVRGCGGWSPRLELQRTDVEALTDVSATDASFFHACAAVWMDVHARAFARLSTVFVYRKSSACEIC